MKALKYPDISTWESLCKRPVGDSFQLEKDVSQIIEAVKMKRDEALIEFNKKFDDAGTREIKFNLENYQFDIDQNLANAIKTACTNITTFHTTQKTDPKKIETTRGVVCWQKSVPIHKVGLYIPGGSAPLFSTLLMLAIPAQLARCEEIVICTPPQKDGGVNEVIGWTCKFLGIKDVFLAGGAQAIAAMAFGTDSVPKVNKVFGPGNQYVTEAKQQIQKMGVAIDMPAGPSEVLVIADKSADPEFIAADLLSQAEHGSDSQVVLVSDSRDILQKTSDEMDKQLEALPRKEIAAIALKNSISILMKDLNEAIEFSNEYAPEHLIIATENCNELAEKVMNAGSVFLGHWSCESAGDYASGTNHTLPTNGFARSYSGVSLDSFMKKITFQKLTKSGIERLGPTIEEMANAEGLEGHKNAVTVRLKKIQNV